MENNFWKSKMGRYAVIAIAYGAILLYIWICGATSSYGGTDVYVTVSMIYIVVAGVLCIPLANKVVNYLYNAIFGNLMLFGPLQMFLEIFLIKLGARLLIMFIVGPVVAPYTIGNFIADKIGAEK